jgi:hypothetical protein
MKKEALRLHNAGFKVIPTNDPTKPDGKKPLCRWKQYQEQQSKEDVIKLFDMSGIGGMALLTGNGIEVIDVDLKYAIDPDAFFTKLMDEILDSIGLQTYQKLILSKTISGGYHIIYKTNIAEGNQKLASRLTLDNEKKNEHDKTRVLLETRGVGGYILIPPTIGYVYDNNRQTLTEMPTLSDWERNKIISVCKFFDETNEIYTNTSPTPIEVVGSHKTTIEAFNESHTPREFIEAAGWQFKYKIGDNLHFVRPGKTLREGQGGCYNQDKQLFYVFTSSTGFEPGRAYNAFQVYAYINHGGDYKKAAKILYNLDYGDRLSKNRDSYNDKLTALTSTNQAQKEKASNEDRMNEIFKKRFDINIIPKEIEYVLFIKDKVSGENIPIASFGDWITVVGAAKSRKSALSNSIAASLLSEGLRSVLSFSGLLQGRNMIVLDTEQNENDYWTSQKQIYQQAAVAAGVNPENFYSFCLTDCRISERLEFVEYVMNRVGNVGVLVLDGIVDICEDYNDQKGSRRLIDHLKVLTAKYKTLFMPVLHNARSTGSARGHLGTELINKSKAVIKVSKDQDENHSNAKFEYIRGRQEPSTFDFGHDSNGNLVLID